MTRNERILHSIRLEHGEGLELGPLTAPILTKDTAAVKYVDHIDTPALKKKYKTEPVELDKIVEVDYALNGRSLKQTVGKKTFDYVVASHVIEHVPDVISWLAEIAAVLKPGGILSLAIPDKRFTFDINRRVSLPADIIGAYLDRLQRPTSATMYDFAMECVMGVDSAATWDGTQDPALITRYWTDEEAWQMCERNLKPGEYVDCHCFVFTPSSFVQVLKELIERGLFDYEVDYFLETQPGELEFYVSLRVPKGKPNRKKQLASLPSLPSHSVTKELAAEIVVLKQEIQALRGSKSWKVTKPLRSIEKLRRKG